MPIVPQRNSLGSSGVIQSIGELIREERLLVKTATADVPGIRMGSDILTLTGVWYVCHDVPCLFQEESFAFWGLRYFLELMYLPWDYLT